MNKNIRLVGQLDNIVESGLTPSCGSIPFSKVRDKYFLD